MGYRGAGAARLAMTGGGMTERSTTDLFRATLTLVRSHGVALLGVAVAYQTLALCVVAPLSAVASARAIAVATGSAAAVNTSLVRLFSSPVSLLLIGAALLLSVSVQVLAAGASAHVVLDGLGATASLRLTFRRLAGLLSIALWRYALLALYSLPPLALALLAYGAVFGARDPVAAYARSPQLLITIGAALAVVLLVLWAYLSLRWAFATAAFVEHGYRGRVALRRSRDLTSGRWVGLGAAIAALSVAAVLVGGVVRGLARGAAIGVGPGADFTVLALIIGVNFLLGLVSLLAVFVAVNSLVLAAYCGASNRLPAPLAVHGTLARAWTVTALVAIAAVAVGMAGVVWTALLSAPSVDPAQVELIAHRAGEAHAPENSLAAVRQAVLDRADRLEFDVQRTADERIVVVHDADLVRLSGQDVSVAESTLQQVQSVDIGEGQRVPTLEEFLDAAGNTPLALEIKTHPDDDQTTREVVALLQRRSAVPKTVVMSLDPELTSLAHRIEPDLATADLVSVAAGEISLLPSDVIAPSESLLSSNLVFLAHAAGKRVWVWAVEDETLLREAVVRGVDGVIVSDIPAARRVIEAMPEVSRAEIVRDRVSEVVGGLAP